MKSCTLLYLGITFLFNNVCISHAQEKSPVEVVQFFNKSYGGPRMDEIADYTTPKFRGNKPKSVWVVDTWKTLHDIKYQKLNCTVIGTTIKEDRAIVAIEAKIKTLAGETAQREMLYLVKEKQRWLIDELIVTEEEIDPEKMKL